MRRTGSAAGNPKEVVMHAQRNSIPHSIPWCRSALSFGVAFAVLLLAGCDRVTGPDDPALGAGSGGAGSGGAAGIIELGGLMTDVHSHSRAHAIYSNPGTGEAIIVGTAHDRGNLKAVLWRVAAHGVVSGPVRLGELPSAMAANYPYHLARDINSSGVIVGDAYYVEAHTIYSQRTVGYVYANGQMEALPRFGDTEAWFAWEINDDGMVAGWIRDAAERNGEREVAIRGALWLPPYRDHPILLSPLEGHASANARTINNNGIIGGWSWTGADTVGVYWQMDPGGSISGPHELAPGFRSSALNDGGYVAGYQSNEAALWNPSAGSLIRLGTLHPNGHSMAWGINNTNEGAFRVVGWSAATPDLNTGFPTMWNVVNGIAEGPVELALPGDYTGGYATDADQRGWIVGVGFQTSGSATVWQALLWRPE
jgi:uncharacterized membrane protein